MKKIYKYLSVLTLLVTLSSCNSNATSSSSSSSNSSSSSSSVSIVTKPKYELEEETNILPFNNGDSISNDIAHSMDLHNVVSKSLKNTNHNSASWIYSLNADFSGIKFSSLQKTTFIDNEVSYQEASLMSPGIEIGRIVNAYYSGSEYVFGHSNSRKLSKQTLSTYSDELELPLDDLEHVDSDFVLSSIGDFQAIENLVPINSFTLDEKNSSYTKDGDTYKITLIADKLSILNNLFSRYHLGNSSLSSYVSLKLGNKFSMNLNFEISDDYDLKKMSFNYTYEDISFQCNLEIEKADLIKNSNNFKNALKKDLKNNSNKEYLDNIKSVTELMRSILLQFSNKSQYTIPLSFGIKEDNQYIFFVNANIELQTLWEYSDFKNLDTSNPTTIFNFIISNVNYNISADILNSKNEKSSFLSSYSSRLKAGQYTYSTSNDTDRNDIKKDFSFHEVDSTHDLLEMLFGDIKNSFDTALDDNKDNFKNYLSSLNSIHENNNSSTLNYIDSYFYNSIINNINFSSNETSDFKSITISSNDSFGNSLVSFLNSNNLNILANTFFAQFDKLKEYNLNIDFSSLSFTFEISQELEYKLLNNLSLNINFKDTEKLYSLFLNIDKISEMNSSSEFVENKYVF